MSFLLASTFIAFNGCGGSGAPGPADSSAAADLTADRPGTGDLAAVDSRRPDLPAAVDRGSADRPRPDGSPADAGSSWPIVASSWDCTSVSKGPPPRRSTVPLGCVLDPACTSTLVVAHRGAGADSLTITKGIYVPLGTIAPENTLSAIRYAIVLGADFVEIDVRATKDGKLVLMHDGIVDRTTTGTGNVADLTLAEIQALELKVGQFKGDYSCERVPTFEEVLELAKGRINIDVDTQSAPAAVALAIQKAAMIDQAFVSSESTAAQQDARSAVPSVRLQVRTGDTTQIPVLFNLFSPKPDIFEIAEAILTAQNITTIHNGKSKDFIDAFYPYDALAYLNNDPNTYAPLIAKNPDMVQVDRTDLVLKLLGRLP